MHSSFEVRDAARYLETCLPRYLKDLEDLVSVDSGTFDKDGVDQVGNLLASRYERLGASVDRHPQERRGDNLVMRLRGGGQGRLLLIGHLDTVFAAGTSSEFGFTLEGERARGPGVADMKSGDLSIVYALEAVIQQAADALGELTIIHNSDEEIGSPDSRDLIRQLSGEAEAVLVLEPGRDNGDIVSGRKGIADGRLTVRGQAAHAGVNHDKGRSAVLELAHLVVAIEGLNGKVPGATLNVGMVEAGPRINVVPDRAFAHFELRAPDGESLEAMVAGVREVVQRRTVPDTSVELDISIEHQPMHKTDRSARLVDLAERVAARLGFEVHDTATGGASDGNTAAAAGKPVLDGLGPVGGGAHSRDEYILIDSIVPRTAMLAGIIASISNGNY